MRSRARAGDRGAGDAAAIRSRAVRGVGVGGRASADAAQGGKPAPQLPFRAVVGAHVLFAFLCALALQAVPPLDRRLHAALVLLEGGSMPWAVRRPAALLFDFMALPVGARALWVLVLYHAASLVAAVRGAREGSRLGLWAAVYQLTGLLSLLMVLPEAFLSDAVRAFIFPQPPFSGPRVPGTSVPAFMLLMWGVAANLVALASEATRARLARVAVREADAAGVPLRRDAFVEDGTAPFSWYRAGLVHMTGALVGGTAFMFGEAVLTSLAQPLWATSSHVHAVIETAAATGGLVDAVVPVYGIVASCAWGLVISLAQSKFGEHDVTGAPLPGGLRARDAPWWRCCCCCRHDGDGRGRGRPHNLWWLVSRAGAAWLAMQTHLAVALMAHFALDHGGGDGGLLAGQRRGEVGPDGIRRVWVNEPPPEYAAGGFPDQTGGGKLQPVHVNTDDL